MFYAIPERMLSMMKLEVVGRVGFGGCKFGSCVQHEDVRAVSLHIAGTVSRSATTYGLTLSIASEKDVGVNSEGHDKEHAPRRSSAVGCR